MKVGYKQLWGSITLAADGEPSRVYATLAAATHFSAAWAMDVGDRIAVEIDTSDGGALIASALTIQRCNMGRLQGGIDFPLADGVKWYDVPVEEATLVLPNADGYSDIYEWDFSAAALYRVKLIVSTQVNVFANAYIS